MIALCTDTSALLPRPLAVELGVLVAPVGVTLDGRDFVERVDADTDRFYARLAEGGHATTSQPSPGLLAALYDAAADRGATHVLSIHLDGDASGTVGAATLAGRDARVPVTVVDTGTASFGVAICVLAAAASVSAGASVAEVLRRVRTVADGIGNVFVAAGAPNGRVPSRPGLPLLSFERGVSHPVGSATDLDHAAESMARHIVEQRDGVHVAVGHAAGSTRPAADALARAVEQSHVAVEVIRYRIGPSVGAHTGPLSFGAFWWSP